MTDETIDETVKTVLVIEKDPNLRLLYETELRNEGYRVLTASKGKEGVKMFAQEKPKVVVFDMIMPDVDGFEVMGEIHGIEQKTRFIVNTVSDLYKDDFRSWIADAYLIKSSDLSPLKEAIKTAFESYGK